MNADLAEWVNQLQATLSKMEVALGAIADAVVFLDVNSQVQWCNRAFVQLIERSHSTIIGSQFRELLPLAQAGVLIEPDTYPDVEMRQGGYEVAEYEFIQGDRRLILQISGSCRGVEYRVRHKNGSWRWHSNNLSVIRDSSDNLLLICLARDITEQKQAEEALKASEAKLNAILSSAVACIQRVRVYANRDWKYEYVSPGSELIYGYTPEEILADDYLLASRLHPQDLEAILPQIFESVFAEGSIGKEYRYLHPDGNWRWIFTTYTSVRNETEDCWVTTIVGTDITGRKQAEIALAESESKFRLIVENANDVIKP